ncbi:hypothetical protein [Microvirga sp. TS319]
MVIHSVSNAVVGRAAALWQLLGNLQRNLNDRMGREADLIGSML